SFAAPNIKDLTPVGGAFLAVTAHSCAQKRDFWRRVRPLPPCGGGSGRGVARRFRIAAKSLFGWGSATPRPNPPPQGGRESSGRHDHSLYWRRPRRRRSHHLAGTRP